MLRSDTARSAGGSIAAHSERTSRFLRVGRVDAHRILAVFPS